MSVRTRASERKRETSLNNVTGLQLQIEINILNTVHIVYKYTIMQLRNTNRKCSLYIELREYD